MSFDTSSILDLYVRPSDAELRVSWVSTAPPGTFFQLYQDGKRVFCGTEREIYLPHPPGNPRYVVGTCLSSEVALDLSAELPGVPGGGNRVSLSWIGGTFLGLDIAGFNVRMGSVPGGPVQPTPVARITAYVQGLTTDGFGMGGFGIGSFGLASASYSWTSDPVVSGTWNVSVTPFNEAGNEGTPTTSSVVVSGPPAPPARDTNGNRPTYTLTTTDPGGFGAGGFGIGGFGTLTGFGLGGFGSGSFGTGAGPTLTFATLNWLASPGV